MPWFRRRKQPGAGEAIYHHWRISGFQARLAELKDMRQVIRGDFSRQHSHKSWIEGIYICIKMRFRCFPSIRVYTDHETLILTVGVRVTVDGRAVYIPAGFGRSYTLASCMLSRVTKLRVKLVETIVSNLQSKFADWSLMVTVTVTNCLLVFYLNELSGKPTVFFLLDSDEGHFSWLAPSTRAHNEKPNAHRCPKDALGSPLFPSSFW
ncbi:hypothetical protein B0H11DRAFT_2007569 [Mycena galericulata]|nr:hypothetical protein B0H11DRAFT_2007569 [Mycena galericulata]